MMLSYKAWRESRARFLVGAAMLCLTCAGFVIGERWFRARIVSLGGPALSYAAYLDARIHRGVARALYLVLAIVLAIGGSARERAHGTLAFTLALPVPSAHHVLARSAVGLVELVALAALPVALVPLGSWLAGESAAPAASVAAAAEWLALGAAALGAGVLLSVVLPGELIALTAGVVGMRFVAAELPLRVACARGFMVALAVALGAIAAAAAVSSRQRLAR